MAIPGLVKRLTKGSELTIAEMDGNFDAIDSALIGKATAAQGALADSAIQPGAASLSDAREWTAPTVTQLEAEAGSSTARRAFTALAVRQSVIAWFFSVTSGFGRAWTQLADVTAARVALGLGSAAFTDASAYQAPLVSGTSIKTINGESVLGAGNLVIAGGGGAATPAGVSTQVQFNDAGAFAGASKVSIGPSGNLLLTENSGQPDLPPSGSIQFYGRLRAGAIWPEFQRSNGREIPVQAHFGLNRIAWWAPSTGTTVSVNGIPRTAVGTVATPTLTTGGLANSCRRWRVSSAATANAVADERSASTACWRGNAAGLGGWIYTNRISIVTLQAAAKAFFGLSSSTAAFATTQDPNLLTNIIGIGFVQGVDTNWQVFRNDGPGAAIKEDMGAAFPVSSTSNVYTLFIYAAPNGSSIWVRVVEEVSGAVFEAEYSTDIPASTVFLSPRNYLNNGGALAAVAYDCSGVYLETDY